ncbi:DUF2206 domain-containing protein [uncultured Methanobacterium sp.]|uniref:DUF2206 domain-containing protein n=1 Tax=uncultured Methanobacterium sp. TaxID=176306 RepID=UPI002AA91376|nr:DUF2206 domain-containing protein [uncultured Methanobacterium sp.]
MINVAINPCKWEKNRFLKLFLVLESIFLVLIGLSYIGVDIFVLRQLIPFFFITFFPGVIILRILKLTHLGIPKTVIYAFGLSMTFLMLIGLLMNTLYPFLGINTPLSNTSLIITLTISITLMALIDYFRQDNNFNKYPNSIYTFKDLIKDFDNPQMLFLLLLPIMAITGTYLVNLYQNTGLLLILYVSICLVVILTVFDKYPKKFYPLIIFIVSLSILFSLSLISPNLWGWDIHFEYHLANMVQNNSIWNPSIAIDYNSMLSVTILPTILSNICKLNLVWVFKIIYPFLFALVPLGMYILFKPQTNHKIAFLCCFFFISFSVFDTGMLALARQEIGEIFLVLILISIFDESDYLRKIVLSLIFGFSLVISHYTLTFLFVFLMMIPALILLNIFYSQKFQKITKSPFVIDFSDLTILALVIIILFTSALVWYGFTSNSFYLKMISDIANKIMSSFLSSFLNPNYAQGLSLLTHQPISTLRYIGKILQLTTQAFMSVGILLTVIKFRETKFKLEYVVLSIFAFIMLLAAIAVPNFASSVNTSRVYQIAMIFLAPFAIIGGCIIIEYAFKMVNKYNSPQHRELPLKIVSIFLIIFFLFDTGFVYAVTNDYGTSIALSQNDMNSTDLDKQITLYNALNMFNQDIISVKWLNQYSNVNSTIYVDYISSHPLISYGKNLQVYYNDRLKNNTIVKKNEYVYLGYPNRVGNIMMDSISFDTPTKTSTLTPKLKKLSFVYDNGASSIYTGSN